MPIMWTSKYLCLKLSFLSACVLAATVSTTPAQAQQGPPVHVGAATITGLPEDWSSRHVVYSNVETEDEALQKGDYEHWQKVVNDPRYVIQQLKNRGEVQGPARTDAEYRMKWILQSGFSGSDKKLQSNVKRDWSEALGGAGLAAGQYPAKYGFGTTTTTCGDYVIYPTGAAGATGQATIVAFNSIYSGCPLYSGGPVVYWAYNTGTGYTANTSPVMPLDGSQVAFVQTNGTTAELVLLKMAASGGTITTPASALTSVLPAAYRGCAAPCYTTYSLGANDTNSAPFYNYGGTDTLYVGDDSGKVHELVGAFYGTPTALDSGTGYPVTASAETSHKLYSPVYDSGGSGLIFVTDTGGYMHSFNAAAPGTPLNSGRMENNTINEFDSPVVDSSNELVYAFIGYGGSTGNPSYINRFAAGTSISGSTGTGLSFGNGSATTNPGTSRMFAGAFDNAYYNKDTSGHLYVCENGNLYQVDTTTAFTTAPGTYDKAVSTVNSTSTCSPVTEFLGVSAATTLSTTITGTGATTVNVASGTGIATGDYIQVDSEIMKVTGGGGTTALTVTAPNRGLDGTTAVAHLTPNVPVQDVQDWLFTSVEANGSATGCTGPCIYNYNVISEAAAGTATAGFGATGGTSGIVIDSSSMAITGDAEVYYTLLGGTSAIQASQAALQ
jgi:hypothetical protein